MPHYLCYSSKSTFHYSLFSYLFAFVLLLNRNCHKYTKIYSWRLKYAYQNDEAKRM